MELLIRIFADGTLLLIAAAAGIALLVGTSMRTKLAYYPYVIMAGLTSLLVGKLMSLIYQPAIARPFLEQGVTPGAAYIDNPGFPSDHVLLATFITLTVAVFVRKRWLAIMMVALVAVMGVSRVAALVHTPLDIFGGLIAGLSGGVWYLLLTKQGKMKN